MRVRVRTAGLRLFLPVPIGLMGFAIRCIPERAYASWRSQIPADYRCLVTKEAVHLLWTACRDLIKDCQGLEIVHVEAQDGTFVSIKV